VLHECARIAHLLCDRVVWLFAEERDRLADTQSLRQVSANALEPAVADHPQPCLWMPMPHGCERGNRQLGRLLLDETSDSEEGWRRLVGFGQ
jgi:hypothetical protein